MDFIIEILFFAFATSITPGPNNIMVFNAGINYGFCKTIPHILGICLGFPIMLICVGLGMGSFFEKYVMLHKLFKIGAALYLIFIAWKIANTNNIRLSGCTNNKVGPISFWQASLFQWINPKAWIMAVVAVSTYTTIGGNYYEIVRIAFIFIIVSFPCVSAWTIVGQYIRKFVTKEKYLKCINITSGLLIIMSLLPILIHDLFV